MKTKLSLLLILASFLFFSQGNYSQNLNEINIPFEKFVLDNGLTLIVHEDHKAPIVAVNVWYHVGSKNEKSGKTGFAHLFEHLMFNGSENFNDDYFKAMEKAGATDINGTTNEDRTNYFQNVPASALDLALWMESDRMGHLKGAISQERLDEQRGVVQNEKRQYDNNPYSIADELITTNTYPKGHPYSWTVIGAMEDLTAASLDDVHHWFDTYYGPSNAVLVIAGDVNPKDVKNKVEKYFGDIKAGPPISKHETWIAKMTGTKRQVAQDRVPQSRLYKVWNVPEWGNKDLTYLDLVSDVLASGKTSRLYKRLVYDDQSATNVNAYISSQEIGSQFRIVANVKPGGDVAQVEAAIDEELAKFLREGPTETELNRVKTQHMANFIRGIERIGGFGGKSDILAMSQVYGGSPDYYKTKLRYVDESNTNDLKNSTVKWLSDGQYILEINPYPSYKTVASTVDRKKLPDTGNPPAAEFPSFEKFTLNNGLNVIVANRTSVPVIEFNLMVNAGYASDQFGIPGTANMAMAMMDEGTKTRNALQISDELQTLGAKINAGSDLDHSYVYLSSLKSNLDKSLQLYTDVILNPSFPPDELERLRKQKIAQIKREKATPIQMALRVFPKFLYGSEHAYGIPFTGSGYEETIMKLNQQDMIDFHNKWFKPNNAVLVVVGDISTDELKPKLETLFANWTGGEVPVKNIKEVEHAQNPIVYILHKTDAPQSIILAGHIAPPKDDEDIAVDCMNKILGGTFTSRINMNLRENKHWSYGSGSVIIDAVAQRPFICYALIQTDKTKESIQEIHKEISNILTTNPPTEEELNKIKLKETLSLPGIWETNGSVLRSLIELVKYNLPEDYYNTYPDKVRNLSLTQIKNAAEKVLHPNNIIWIVVGDQNKIESPIKELGYEVKHIDGDGVILD